MIIEIYGLLAEDHETEVHVGRIYVHTPWEANRIVHKLNCLTKKLPEHEQFICEYRWEEGGLGLKKMLTLVI